MIRKFLWFLIKLALFLLFLGALALAAYTALANPQPKTVPIEQTLDLGS